MSRPDQSITFLRGHAFSVFRFPRASAQPLELMHREGKDLTRLGMVPDLVTAGEVASPRVHRGKSPGIDIEGKETSKVNVAIFKSDSTPVGEVQVVKGKPAVDSKTTPSFKVAIKSIELKK